jgi:trk system potassium uptake protein TrkH
MLILIGTALLMLPGVGTTRSLHLNEALFTATSAISVTGLSIIVPSQDLTMLGQIILLCLIQLGGVGFMSVAVVVFLLLGRKVSLMNRNALCDSLGLVQPGAIIGLAWRVLAAVLIFESIGAFLLWLHWRSWLGDERAIFYAIFHSISAFCNAGFDLFSGLPETVNPYPGIPTDPTSLLILGTLIFIGGLGIPVLADFVAWQRNQRLSLHTRITLVVVVSLTCASWLGMFLAERVPGGTLATHTWQDQLILPLFQAVSTRTAGFAAIQPFGDLSPASQLLLIAMMFIGAAPASMGGGITTGTFAVLMLTLLGYARGLPTPEISGRSISPDPVRKAGAVVTISLFLVMFAAWLILMTHDTPLNLALFEVVSAFATCGLSLGLTSDLNSFGQGLMIIIMFWGRLGALTIVATLAQQRAARRVEYPEEQILIG